VAVDNFLLFRDILVCKEVGRMGRNSAGPFLILTLTSIFLSPNCATLTRSRDQIIPVTSSPAGATIIVNGVRKGVTPTRILLTRKDKDQAIRIEYPGYYPFEIRVTRYYSGFHAVANVIMGGIAGLAVGMAWVLKNEYTVPHVSILLGIPIGGFLLIDLVNHAGYTLTPKDLTVTLTKADGISRVDTLLVDADDFRNIKWIRVRRD
jgi:hypothetical protein